MALTEALAHALAAMRPLNVAVEFGCVRWPQEPDHCYGKPDGAAHLPKGMQTAFAL